MVHWLHCALVQEAYQFCVNWLEGVWSDSMPAPTRRFFFICLSVLFGVLQTPLLAQQERIVFRHLTVAEGLSQGDVTAILQDSLGFLWFGTEDGLNRYDGHQVRIFKPSAFDTTSLSHPWIVGLVPDGGAGMWVATEGGGLVRYNARTESFQSEPRSPRIRVSQDLFALAKARDGTLWAGTRYDGLYSYDRITGRAVAYHHASGSPTGLPDSRVTALLEDRVGRVWIGTGRGGLATLDPESSKISTFQHDPGKPHSLPGNQVAALYEDRRGTIWVGTSPGGLSRYRPVTRDFTNYRHDVGDVHSLGHPSVHSIFQDPDGTLWVGTGNGLDRMNPTNGTFSHFRHDPADLNSVRPGAVRALHLDRTGAFWVGTSGGASFFRWNSPPFGHLTSDPEDPNTLLHADVWSILVDRAGVLWVGTTGGLSRVDRSTGRVTRYPIDSNDPHSLVGESVMGLYEDRAGTFWVGTRTGALHVFDRATGKVTRRFIGDPGDATSLKSDTPWRIYEDAKGRFWITSGGRGCLHQMDPSTYTFEAYCHDPVDANTPAHDIAHDLIESRTGDFWLGTWGGGLDRFDPDAGSFANYRHDPKDPGTLASDFVIALHEAADGMLWLGLYGAGLDRFDPRTGEFVHYTSANSDLPNDIVLSIEEDAQGDLWISSYQGLARFTPATGRFRSYGLEDGLQDLEFNSRASFRAPTGELFFGGINGINAFFPHEIGENPVPPPVVLTDLQIRGMRVGIDGGGPLEAALPFVRSLALRHDQRDLEFSFAGLHYTNPERNRYRYILQGYDDAWHEPGPHLTATYTNLDPGEYTFRVQAANSSGIWNESGTTLAITISPPAWRTWWAYALYIVALGTVLSSLRRYEMNRLRLHSRLEIERVDTEKLRELDRAKTHFFANVSHEFRTPLTLTIGPLDDLRAGLYGPMSDSMTEQVDLARRSATRVLDLINEILEIARLEAGRTSLRARAVDLAAFVQDHARAFESFAERKGVRLEVQAPPEPILVFADARHLERILSNLLSNAFKFTPEGGVVRVIVSADGEAARVAVRDSGPGISPNDLSHVFERFYRVSESSTRMQPGTGIGLALARELVELHGGSLSVESEEGAGSTFTVMLRRGHAHLSPEQLLSDDAIVPWKPPRVAHPLPSAPGGNAVRQTALGRPDDDVTTVLVVEDSAELRSYVRRHLEPAFRVIEAADGEAGLALAHELLPDLVLSDVMMPGLDGFALCRALKSNPETDFIPVILLTARAAVRDRIDGLHEQADDYLTKPFEVVELRARIDNLIKSRKRLRERFRHEATTSTNGKDGKLQALRPGRPDVTSVDAALLERVRKAVEEHLGDETFNVERMAELVGVSRGHLHRRFRSLLDQSPSEAIRTMRLERAAQLLLSRAGTVGEVAYAVGFKSVAHFSNAFDQLFGCRPSAYAAGAKRSDAHALR